MFIIKYKKIFVSISIALVVLSVISLSVFGLKVGIDFKGGALTEVIYKSERPVQATLNKTLAALNFGSILLQPTGELGYIVKSQDLNDQQHSLLLKTLSENDKNPLQETSFNSIGPAIGRELTRKAIISIILISLAIICFIAYAYSDFDSLYVFCPTKEYYGYFVIISYNIIVTNI